MMNLRIFDLPDDVIDLIAGSDGHACWLTWLYTPRYRRRFRPRAVRVLFIQRFPKYTHVFGQLHSVDDEPSCTLYDCLMHCERSVWHYRGKHHREHGPAIIQRERQIYWMRHGKSYRVDGPHHINLDYGVMTWSHGLFDSFSVIAEQIKHPMISKISEEESYRIWNHVILCDAPLIGDYLLKYVFYKNYSPITYFPYGFQRG